MITAMLCARAAGYNGLVCSIRKARCGCSRPNNGTKYHTTGAKPICYSMLPCPAILLYYERQLVNLACRPMSGLEELQQAGELECDMHVAAVVRGAVW